MIAKFDIKMIQNMNLFERITGVKAKCCFNYNFVTVFVVQKQYLSRALGENAFNIQKIGNRLNKKIRIVAYPQGKQDLEKFIQAVIFPFEFKNVILNNNELQIFSQPQTKAVLIGRNKARLEELSGIINQFFGIKKVVIK